MSAYVGIHTQIARNNRLSVIYLIGFPLLILLSVWAFIFLMLSTDPSLTANNVGPAVNDTFLSVVPTVLIIVSVWFTIAYLFNTSMIQAATKAKTLERRENMRIYNLTENLCIAQGMTMPKLNIIESEALNAFASGINEKSFTVTLTRGLIEKLNDEELEGVIAHELCHIQNRDVRLLIVSIVFVGIFSFAVQFLMRSFFYGNIGGKRNRDSGKALIIAFVIAIIAYLISLVFKFGLSRKREYMADAGAADMTKNPQALASALRKISGNHQIDANDDVRQLFIENEPKLDLNSGFSITRFFATHPPIEKRIKILESF